MWDCCVSSIWNKSQQLPWQKCIWLILQILLRIQPGEASRTSKVCQHNQLPTHHAGLCVTLCFSWGIGVWSACDPGPFNILGISNGSTMVCYAPGLNCYLDMICQTAQDETCCSRNRKKKSVPSKITQQFICHLPSVCSPQSSTSSLWQLLIITTLFSSSPLVSLDV